MTSIHWRLARLGVGGLLRLVVRDWLTRPDMDGGVKYCQGEARYDQADDDGFWSEGRFDVGELGHQPAV